MAAPAQAPTGFRRRVWVWVPGQGQVRAVTPDLHVSELGLWSCF